MIEETGLGYAQHVITKHNFLPTDAGYACCRNQQLELGIAQTCR